MGWNNNDNKSQDNQQQAQQQSDTQSQPAAPAPAPLLNLNMTDPAALELVRKRVVEAKASRGRNSLRIPLSPAATGAGGISIPR